MAGEEKAHRLHVYTGDGKGKTTAAMGLALRSLGHGHTVLVAQFMKDGRSGELAALRTLGGAHVLTAPPMAGFLSAMTADERQAAARQQSAFLREAEAAVRQLRPQLVVLDELAVALRCRLVDGDEARRLIDACLQYGETVITGRGAPDWLTARADYVSVINAAAHPYAAEGLPAREGIEW